MKTIIISDLHLGAIRRGGTTPSSAQALKQYIRGRVERLLDVHQWDHVVINGDLFDAFDVESSELIEAYELFTSHLYRGRLTLVMGNHDASAKAGRVSSFHLLSHFLQQKHPENLTMIDHHDGLTEIEPGLWAISHQLNQDLFNVQLDRAIAMDGKGKQVLLHCNIKNGHAEHSDHSLNLNDEQLNGLMKAGWSLICGHEHIGYKLREGRVIVVGNQFPTSISDCIDDPEKHYIVMENGVPTLHASWDAASEYAEMNWKNLEINEKRFVRVVGEATAEESADVIKAVARFRQQSPALVINNSVVVDGVAAMDDLTQEALNSVKGFDILSAIMEHLTPAEQIVVKELSNA